MGLVVLAKFSVLGEAQVARAALESAGLFAIVQDEGVGQLNFLWRQFLQGFRLCVVAAEYDDARGVLIQAVEEGLKAEPSDIPVSPRPPGWIVAGLVPGVVWPEWGLFIEGFRLRPQRLPVAFLSALAGGLVVLAIQVAIGWEDACKPGTRRAQSPACLSR